MPDVRQATLDDLDRLATLFNDYRVFYGKPSDLPAARAFLRDRFERDQSVVFLADAGFAQVYPGFSSISLAPAWLLNDLYVEPAARARGVGRALVRTCIDHARDAGAAYLTLETATDNTVAISLYESVGFRVNTEFHQYVLAL